MTDGRLHPYRWARELLAAEFGEDRVDLEASPDGGRVTATVAGGSDEAGAAVEAVPYVVLLRDPVLGNVNGFADPRGFVAAEVAAARALFDGKSRRRRSYG